MYEFTIPNYHPMMAQKRGDKGMSEGEWRKGGKISSNTINTTYQTWPTMDPFERLPSMKFGVKLYTYIHNIGDTKYTIHLLF